MREVLVLQGTPAFGILFSIGTLSPHKFAVAALALTASCCLVAHVFVFNDWSGLSGDLRDPHRAKTTFVACGVSRSDAGYLSAFLAVAALALLVPLGLGPVALGSGILACSTLYSAPHMHFKGVPVANSILHLVGGALHFQLGYGLYRPLDARGWAIAAFFAMTFAAGHLTHEARDWEGDKVNAIRTNAVRFGRRACVTVSLALFALAYALLAGLAWSGTIPRPIAWSALFFPVQLFWTYRAFHHGLTFETLGRLQARYRLLFLMIGAIMIACLAPTLLP
jgi:4-hydroxybenzoate polyprenyltransferase